MAHELAAAVDLDGLQGHGEGFDDVVEEAPGVEGGGAGEDAGDHEAAERADGAELLDGSAVAGEGHVVDLDELAGVPGPGAVLPALRPAVELAAAPGLEAALAGAGAGHAAAGDGAREDASDGGDAQAQALAFEHALDGRLAHERMLAAQVHDGLHVARLVRPAADVARAGGLRRKAALAARGQRGLPPEHGAAADADLLQGGLLGAAGGAQLLEAPDGQQAFAGRRRQLGAVHLEAAVRSRPHGLDVHGSGSPSVGLVHRRLPEPAPAAVVPPSAPHSAGHGRRSAKSI